MLTVGMGILVLGGILLTRLQSYLLFHSIAEMFSIVIAFAVFIYAWNARYIMKNNYLLVIGIALFFCGTIDLVHTLAFKGMGVFTPNESNLPTSLWIASRYLLAFSFLLAPLFVGKVLKPGLVFAIYFVVTTLLFLSILYWKIFPVCYIEGKGLTPFKIISEYIICGILFIAFGGLWRKRTIFDAKVFWLLGASVFNTIFSELAFTQYIGVYATANLVGHLFKIVSFYLIYEAILVTGFRQPMDVLFKNLNGLNMTLKSSEERFREVLENSLDAAYKRDLKTTSYEYLSPVFTKISGYTMSEMNTLPLDEVLKIMHPADIAEVTRVISQAMSRDRGSENSVEYRFKRKAGDYRWLRDKFIVTRDSNGEPLALIGSVSDITDHKQAEEFIRSQAEVTEHMTEGAYIVGLHDGIIRWANHHFESMFGYEIGEMLGKHVSIVNSPSVLSSIEQANQIMETITKTGEWHGEVNNIRKDGTTFWCAASVSTFIHHQYGEVMLALHTDITGRKLAEDKIRASLAEKETLLKEVHHRVKNNMQVISSLLQMQSGFVKDKQDAHLFRESQDRIKSMSLVYNKLYQSQDLANISMKDYLTELVENLVRAYSLRSDQVGTAIDIDDTVLSLDLAIPCGLIANEIVVNSLKYAFKDGRKGLIHVSGHKSGEGEIEIKIGDNGVGLPENAGPGTTQTLGMILIQTLVQEQLGGQVQINRNQGTEYVITFSLNSGEDVLNGKD